jgi:hypothetical protein
MASKEIKNADKNIQSEVQVPPIMLSNQSQTSEIEDQKEINSSQEKLYLEGEEHIDPYSLDSNNVQVKEQLSLKPREAYLKEKIDKENYDLKLINNIQKDIKYQVNEIKSEISDNKVSINEKINDLSKIMDDAKKSKEKYLVKYSDKEYNLRNKHKILSTLREEQNTLKSKLLKIEENESLLQSEGFMNLNKSFESQLITPYDKSIKEQKKKSIKQQKTDLNERLKEVEFRISQIIQEENDQKFSKKEKLENYKQNFEKDKEIIKARADKYLKEIKERNKRMSQDMEKLVEKRKKEIEKKEKEDEEKKKQILDKFKEKEKEIERKRIKEKRLIMAKYMPYRKLKLETKEDDYTYAKLKKKYENTENYLFKQVNLEKKNKSKMVTPEELQNFREQIEIKKEEIKKLKEEKDSKEKEKFEVAKHFKPSYKSKYDEKTDDELHNKITEQQNKQIIIQGLTEKKNDFGKKVHQPTVNEAKKKERLDVIVKLKQPELFQVKYTLKKKEKEKEKEKSTEKKSLKWLYKLQKEAAVRNLNNSSEMENPITLIKRPKKIKLSTSFSQNIKKENVNAKQFNYLEELRQKKIIGNKKNNEVAFKIGENKNLISELEQMKEKTSKLENRAQMGEELLRVNGGIANNPKLGKEVSELYINSIGAKINVLNHIYDDENNNNEKDNEEEY